MHRRTRVTSGISGLLMALALAITVPAGAATAQQAGPDASVARPPAGVVQSRAAAAATKNKVLVGQNGNLSIITPQGDLLMYYHHGWIDGSANFSPGYDHGDGWNAFVKVISVGVNDSYDNMYLAIASNGNMYGYYWKHNEQRWVNPAGTLVGQGWQGTQKLISGGNYGYETQVYRITDGGQLYYYHFSGVPGEGGGFTESGLIGTAGWGGFLYATASQDHFYGVQSNGDVLFYKYNWAQDRWDNQGVGQVIHRNWTGGSCGFQTVQAGGYYGNGDVIYGVDGSGRLRWLRHSIISGGHYWYPSDSCGFIVGSGWM